MTRTEIYSEGFKSLGFKSYNEYLNSDMWKDKAMNFIEKKGYCEICYNTKGLIVHHKSYLTCGNESEEDLMVLCYWCHAQIHEKV